MDPTIAVQGAIYTACKNAAVLQPFLYDSDNDSFRMFDQPASKKDENETFDEYRSRLFPHVRIGSIESQSVQRGCLGKEYEVFVPLDVFSIPSPSSTLQGSLEAKTILSHLQDVLVGDEDAATPPLYIDTHKLNCWEVVQSRAWYENDQYETIHGLLKLRYLLSG